jgi:hypothetical protein
MNLGRAATYLFADRSWPRKFGLIALVSPVPVFGQLYALGYANLTLRRIVKGNKDGQLPEAKLGWELCWLGIQVMLATLLCGILVALICAPLFFGDESSSNVMAPALIQALQGPTALLTTCVSTVLTAIVLVRLALTKSFTSGFDPFELWKLLRAEPSLWICYAVLGFLVTEGPYALVWVLPLHGGWDVAATMLACTVLWSYGLMINVHLIGQAFHYSRRTAALRAAQVRYRW